MSDPHIQTSMIITGKEYTEMQAEIERLKAEVKRKDAALVAIRDLEGEINMGNYTDDDVRKLNNAFIEAYAIALDALGPPPALTPLRSHGHES